MISRRTFGQWTALFAAGLPATASVADELDLSTPQANLHAYMKLHTSVEKSRIWYWYTGILRSLLPKAR